MKRAEARTFLAAIRRAGDQLAIGLSQLREARPDDLRVWELRWARAMGEISEHLLEPLLTEPSGDRAGQSRRTRRVADSEAATAQAVSGEVTSLSSCSVSVPRHRRSQSHPAAPDGRKTHSRPSETSSAWHRRPRHGTGRSDLSAASIQSAFIVFL